ncbi:MAG: tyrosine-protein phosphatase [Cytophagales bacterium]
MLSFLKKTPTRFVNPLTVDVHSHLLAGIDDGSKSWEESIEVLKVLSGLGYQKFITTPHVMSDVYRNEPMGIRAKLTELRSAVETAGLSITIEVAAEYYLDEVLMKKITYSEEILTFNKTHLLFETNFRNEPLQTKDFIFQATLTGYQLILAHPERYEYMTLAKAEDLRNRGVLFQINILSIMGYYSRPVQKMAQQFIDKGWVELLGSDCHNLMQANFMREHQNNKYFQKAVQLPLLNNQL